MKTLLIFMGNFGIVAVLTRKQAVGFLALGLLISFLVVACGGGPASTNISANPSGSEQQELPGTEEFGLSKQGLVESIEAVEALIVGAIGIGNVMLVSVIERTGEIGLRRSIGATQGHIAAQFLVESSSLGVIGGILGAGFGILIVVAVSAFQTWTPVLDPWAPFVATLIGGLIGLVSGTYPALRASRLEPIEAIRWGI